MLRLDGIIIVNMTISSVYKTMLQFMKELFHFFSSYKTTICNLDILMNSYRGIKKANSITASCEQKLYGQIRTSAGDYAQVFHMSR